MNGTRLRGDCIANTTNMFWLSGNGLYTFNTLALFQAKTPSRYQRTLRACPVALTANWGGFGAVYGAGSGAGHAGLPFRKRMPKAGLSYDLGTDPKEMSNAAAGAGGRVDELRAALGRAYNQARSQAGATSQTNIDGVTRDRLKALGYLD